MDEILLQENNKSSAEYEAHENIKSDFDENDLYQIGNMSLDYKKENIEWRKRDFECKIDNKNDIEIQNGMPCIYGNKVNKLDWWNLLHNILNPPKRTKYIKSHYSIILQGCMNISNGRAKLKNFWNILYSERGSTIIMGRLIKNLIKHMLWYSEKHRLFKITTN